LFSSGKTEEESATAATESASRKPVKGDVVTADVRLTPEGDFVPEPLFDGIVLREGDDQSESLVRLTFVLGGGNYLPGLHDLLLEMRVGETRTNVSLDAGWGARNPDLVLTVAWDGANEHLRGAVKPGAELRLRSSSGGAVCCAVTDVTDGGFTVDANPPLAGASYEATCALLAAEPGPVPTRYGQRQPSRYQVATFALGCFWGGELEYMREPGVVGTAVGYTQGSENVAPTYEEVCSGTTGHAEAILVSYDPDVVTYDRLVHLAMDRLGENKYLLNRVGNDVGTQYRHGVYYHTEAQKEIAEKIVGQYGVDCVTECKPATTWYPAEDYHQQYLLKLGQSARKGDKTVIRCYG
jgi:peptide-methionine (S)-S-oxide reductase